MSGDSTGADEGTRVVETALIRARREQRQQAEPYRWPLVIVFWCAGAFVLIRIVDWPVVTMTDTAILLIWVGLTAYLTWFVARAPLVARVETISSDGIQLSMRKTESVVVPYSAIVSAEARSVRWDDQVEGEAPFMKSVTEYVISLSEISGLPLRLSVFDGRDSAVRTALIRAGVAMRGSRRRL